MCCLCHGKNCVVVLTGDTEGRQGKAMTNRTGHLHIEGQALTFATDYIRKQKELIIRKLQPPRIYPPSSFEDSLTTLLC